MTATPLDGLPSKTFLKRLQRATEQTRLDLKSTAAYQPASGTLDDPSADDRG